MIDTKKVNSVLYFPLLFSLCFVLLILPYSLYHTVHLFSSLLLAFEHQPLLISLFLSLDSFEEAVPDMTNLSEYTYESLVFSFSLLGAMGSLLSDDYDPDADTDTDAEKLSSAAVTENLKLRKFETLNKVNEI